MSSCCCCQPKAVIHYETPNSIQCQRLFTVFLLPLLLLFGVVTFLLSIIKEDVIDEDFDDEVAYKVEPILHSAWIAFLYLLPLRILFQVPHKLQVLSNGTVVVKCWLWKYHFADISKAIKEDEQENATCRYQYWNFCTHLEKAVRLERSCTSSIRCSTTSVTVSPDDCEGFIKSVNALVEQRDSNKETPLLDP